LIAAAKIQKSVAGCRQKGRSGFRQTPAALAPLPSTFLMTYLGAHREML
jgi:hypothetical protein